MLICQFGIVTEGIIIEKKLKNTLSLLGGAQAWNHFNNEKSKVSKRYRKVFNKEYGTETLLDPVFDFYREAFLDLVVRAPRWTRTVNATEGGSLFGKRIENMKFTDFLTLVNS